MTNLAAAAGIAVLAAIAFSASLTAGFVCDDTPVIVENDSIKSLANIPQFFTAGSWDNTALEASGDDQSMLRPLQFTTFALTYAVWGLKPFGYHLVNVLLHALNAALVFLVLRRLAPNANGAAAFLAAALFAVHPIHIEPVSWIVGVHDILFAFFCLLSFLLYLSYKDSGRTWQVVASLALFVPALLSKETAITYPALVIAHDYLSEKRFRLPVIEALGAMAAAYLGFRRLVLGATVGSLGISPEGVLRVIEYFGGYLRWLVFPWPQRFYLAAPPEGAIAGWEVAIAWALFVAVLAIALRRRGTMLLGLVWIVAPLLPALSMALHEPPLYAMRFLYFPAIGVSVVLLSPLSAGLERHFKPTLAAVCAVTIVCIVGVNIGGRHWKHDGVFYSKVIKDSPASAAGHAALGDYLAIHATVEEATQSYQRAANYGTDRQKVTAYNLIGEINGQAGHLDISKEHYLKSIGINPVNSHAHSGLGNIYLIQKDLANARKHYEQAVQQDPNNPVGYYNLALCYDGLGDRAKANHYYRAFIEIAPPAEFAQAIASVIEKLKAR